MSCKHHQLFQSYKIFLKVVLAGILFGVTGLVFSKSIVLIKKFYARWMPNPVVRSFVGGSVIILFVLVMYCLNRFTTGKTL